MTEQNKREYVDLLASWRLKGLPYTFNQIISELGRHALDNCVMLVCVHVCVLFMFAVLFCQGGEWAREWFVILSTLES